MDYFMFEAKHRTTDFVSNLPVPSAADGPPMTIYNRSFSCLRLHFFLLQILVLSNFFLIPILLICIARKNHQTRPARCPWTGPKGRTILEILTRLALEIYSSICNTVSELNSPTPVFPQYEFIWISLNEFESRIRVPISSAIRFRRSFSETREDFPELELNLSENDLTKWPIFNELTVVVERNIYDERMSKWFSSCWSRSNLIN